MQAQRRGSAARRRPAPLRDLELRAAGLRSGPQPALLGTPAGAGSRRRRLLARSARRRRALRRAARESARARRLSGAASSRLARRRRSRPSGSTRPPLEARRCSWACAREASLRRASPPNSARRRGLSSARRSKRSRDAGLLDEATSGDLQLTPRGWQLADHVCGALRVSDPRPLSLTRRPRGVNQFSLDSPRFPWLRTTRQPLAIKPAADGASALGAAGGRAGLPRRRGADRLRHHRPAAAGEPLARDDPQHAGRARLRSGSSSSPT